MAGAAREPRYLRPLRRAAEALLALLIVGAPVAIGGVHPQVMIAVAWLGGCALLLLAVGRTQGIPIPAAGWALAAGGLFAVATTIPLPFAIVRALSARAAALSFLRPEAAPSLARLSLDAPATLVDAARILGLAAVTLAAAAVASRPDGLRRLARLIAVAAVAVVLVSIAHMLLGVTELFGLVPQPFEGRSFTTFIDPNHAASLAILSTLAALGLASSRTGADSGARLGWYAVAGIGVAMAISTQSVAGLAALALALGLYVVLSLRRRLNATGRGVAAIVIPGTITVVALLALLAGAILFLDAADPVMKAGWSKIASWPATVRLVRDFRWVGVGRGAFASAFEAYMPPRHEVTYSHPENFVLQWAAEWGVPAACLGIAALLYTFWRAFRLSGSADDRLGPIHDALLAGTIAVLVHELADFGLEYAGVGVPFCVALGILGARSARPIRVRPIPLLIGAVSLASAVVAARVAMPRLLDAQLTEASFHTELTEGATAAGIDAAYRHVRDWHPASFLVPMRAVEALFHHADDPVTPRESRESLARTEPYLDRASELSQNDWSSMSRAWLAARQGHRAEALRFVHDAYARGHRWQEAVRFELKLEATPDELSALPLPVGGGAPAVAGEAPESACVLLETLGQGRMRRLTAGALLDRMRQGQIEAAPRLRDCLCASYLGDATCSRDGQIGCDAPDSVPEIVAGAVSVGRDWIESDPTDARAYVCVSQAYSVVHADEERARVLAVGESRMPDDLLLKAALAEALVDGGKPAQALEAVRDVVPEMADGHVARLLRTTRIRALWDLGQRSKALREAEETVQLNPSLWWPYDLAAQYEEQGGDFSAATDLLAQGSRFAPEGVQPSLDAWRARLEREKQSAAAKPRDVDATPAAVP